MNTAISLALLVISSTPTVAGDWQLLSDGDSLSDWKKLGGQAVYTIKDGVITGETRRGKNTFLTRGPYADFELEFEVRCDVGLNSGVQIRSHQFSEDTAQESKPERIREKGEVYGYQCEIRDDLNLPHGCAGNFWDESRRTKWLDETVDAAAKQKFYKPGEWNHFRIVAKGRRIQSFVNGQPVADFTDDRDASGFIGLQVHSVKDGTGPFQVSWRKVRIRELD